MRRTRVLITAPHFPPAWKAGGAARSLGNLVLTLGDEFEFRVITSNIDLDGSPLHSEVEENGWRRFANAQVLYLAPQKLTLRFWKSFLRNTPHDLLYLSNLFSPVYTIRPLLLRRLGWIPPSSVLLSPRGDLVPLRLKKRQVQKKAYRLVAKLLGLYRHIHWHATGSEESDQIRHENFGNSPEGTPSVFVAPNLVLHDPANLPPPKPPKIRGSLRIVFLARISPEKNLHGALQALQTVRGEVRFALYGPIADSSYWRRCEEIIERLPENITVEYRGPIPPFEVISTLSQYDLYFFPTLGENFGHSIIEALLAGCPILISDLTPWRGLLERGVGRDVGLSDASKFAQAIQEFVGMDEEEHRRLSRNAFEYGSSILKKENERSLELHRSMLALACRPKR